MYPKHTSTGIIPRSTPCTKHAPPTQTFPTVFAPHISLTSPTFCHGEANALAPPFVHPSPRDTAPATPNIPAAEPPAPAAGTVLPAHTLDLDLDIPGSGRTGSVPVPDWYSLTPWSLSCLLQLGWDAVGAGIRIHLRRHRHHMVHVPAVEGTPAGEDIPAAPAVAFVPRWRHRMA